MKSSGGDQFPIIRVLPEQVANQIAAGEVVERPASVVKELVENALDAGATRIDVSIEGGGIKHIEVDDNGCGMDRSNALACLERQATSKIAVSEDIIHIATFGFRGEAIPSIASVSRFSLITRPRTEEAATSLVVVGGTLEDVGAAGHPVGTTVSVRDLFFNVPARRKFLRAATTETVRIRQTLTAMALSYPSVAFRFRSDGRDVFRLPAGDSLEDRIRTLLGESISEALLPLHGERDGVVIRGFLSKPGFSRGGTPEQYIFVNHRAATAPQVQYALREAWPVKDPRPVAVLFIDLPPEEVDVNVHPAKREVRFRHGNRVVTALFATMNTALTAQAGMTPPHSQGKSLPEANQSQNPVAPEASPQAYKSGKGEPRASFMGVPHFEPAAYPLGLTTFLPTPQAPLPHQQALHLPLPGRPPVVSSSTSEHASSPLQSGSKGLGWKWMRVVAVLEPGFWLVITDIGFLTVDAKAVVERILYERFETAGEALPAQPLLIPETLSLPPLDAERVKRFLPELAHCGFDLTALGGDQFLINAFPVSLADEVVPREMIASLALELDRTGVRRGIEAWRQEVVARAAARAASGVVRVTTLEAAETLMGQLAQCAMPYITPRGRPVVILTSYRELARRFQREL